jgi:hypothetical protein
LTVQRVKSGNNDNKIVFNIATNVGLWKITDVKYNLASNSPVGIRDGSTGTRVTDLQWYVNPLGLATEFNSPGTYNFSFQVTSIPTLSNGERDNARQIKIENFTSDVTISVPPNPLGTFIESYTNRAGNEFDLYWKKSGFNTTVYAYKKGTTQLQYTNPPSSTASLSVLVNETKLYLQDNVFN